MQGALGTVFDIFDPQRPGLVLALDGDRQMIPDHLHVREPEEPLLQEKLCGLTEAQLRSRSHRPQEFYGQPHFMPEARDGMVIARLNRARCAARSAELAAAHAFADAGLTMLVCVET